MVTHTKKILARQNRGIYPLASLALAVDPEGNDVHIDPETHIRLLHPKEDIPCFLAKTATVWALGAPSNLYKLEEGARFMIVLKVIDK